MRLLSYAHVKLPNASPWTNPAFVAVWLGQLVSGIGDQLYILAMPWLIYDITGSSAHMGMMRAVEHLPGLLFGVFIGVLADRLDVRRMMLSASLLLALIIGLVPTLLSLQLLPTLGLYVLAFITSTLTQTQSIGWKSVMPSLVGKEQLVEANAAWGLTRTLAGLFGPALAGVIIGWAGPLHAFFIDSLTFVAPIVVLLLVRFPQAPRRGMGTPRDIWRDASQGIGFMWSHPLLRSAIGLTLIMNVGMGIMFALLVFHVRVTLGFSPQLTGVVFSFGTGGSLLANLAIHRLIRELPRGRIILVGSALVGLSVSALAAGRTWVDFGIIYAAVMASIISVNIHLLALIQQAAPANMMGRVMSTTAVFSRITVPVTATVAGLLAQWVDSGLAFLFAGGLVFMTALAGWYTPIRDAAAE